MQHEDRTGNVGAYRGRLEHLQFVVDRVPVVITVDEGEVDGREIRKHREAEVAMEHVPTRKSALVFERVELGHGIDDVHFGLGAE